MPPKTEPPPELPAIPNERFGGDSVVADFAEKLACCEAQRKAAGEVASRFEKAKSAAAKAEDEQAKKDQEKAIQEAIEKLEKPEKEDAKYRREVARVTRIAKAEAQKEAVAKKKAAVAAITREDLGAVQQELAQWILDDLSDDFLKSMNEAIKEYADTWRKPMLRAITKERTAQEKKLAPKAKPRPKSKPKVVTAPEPPEPEPPTREQILEEVEASLVRVRCEQQAWVANRLESFKHAWMAGRRERVDFRTSVPTVPERALKWGTEFKAPDVPEADRVPIPDDLKDSPGEKQPPIAPELLSFLRRLQRLEPGVKAGNYGDPPHGSLGFAGKGFSVDLSLTGNKAGPLDERGFYPHDAAVNLLLHIDEASKVADAEWDVIYNDFTVAEEVNRKLKTRRVSYVGGLDKTGRLNWHGPAPLKLHFHLDYMPKMDKPDPEAEKIRSAHLMFKILKLLLPVPSAPAAPGLKKKK